MNEEEFDLKDDDAQLSGQSNPWPVGGFMARPVAANKEWIAFLDNALMAVCVWVCGCVVGVSDTREEAGVSSQVSRHSSAGQLV